MTDDTTTDSWGDATAKTFEQIADTIDTELRPHVDEEGQEMVDTIVSDLNETADTYRVENDQPDDGEQ